MSIVLKRIWDFLWNSNSIWSWIIDFILVFLIVKFIFFPFFGLLFSTSLPFAIIESDSMHHQGNFDYWYTTHAQWYNDNDISKETITSWSHHDGLDKGDIIIVIGKKPSEIKLGEIIIFQSSVQKTPIIHRVVDIQIKENKYYFSTKGDNNPGQLLYSGFNIEQNIPQDKVIGVATTRIRWLGWVKLIFTESFKALF